jgi:hypothetical protein
MINIALAAGDFQGDMVPVSSDPVDLGGEPAKIIKAGHALYSPGGAFRLTFLSRDAPGGGGAVIQAVDDTTLQWKSGAPINPASINWVTIWTGGNTAGQEIKEVAMQVDGNFVVYTAPGTGPMSAPFNSETEQPIDNSGAFLRLQDDGNLVIFLGSKAIWSTGTNARTGGILAQSA